MKKFKFRTATKDDRQKVQQLFAHSVANEKNLFNPELVKASFIDDFVNKIIDQGNMIIVENGSDGLELIGEVHYYNTSATESEKYVKELVFFSRLESENDHEETELFEWLYGEIEQKHSDVFSVDLSMPVSKSDSVALFMKKGINIECNYRGRLSKVAGKRKVMLPLKWINPSFN
jgi:hypothetical protein